MTETPSQRSPNYDKYPKEEDIYPLIQFNRHFYIYKISGSQLQNIPKTYQIERDQHNSVSLREIVCQPVANIYF